MSAQTTQRAVKTGSAFAQKVRDASITAKGSILPLGSEIYAHSHLQTKQVVYTLQRHIKVNTAGITFLLIGVEKEPTRSQI